MIYIGTTRASRSRRSVNCRRSGRPRQADSRPWRLAYNDSDKPVQAGGRPSTPAARGANGLQGAPGVNGAAGPRVKLKIAHLIGSGTLTIKDNGQAGGQGQGGGNGQVGTDGRKGDDRGCGNLLGRGRRSPTNGGNGGKGGMAGPGGPGGKGGDGGLIEYSRVMQDLVSAKRVVLMNPGGPGGVGGPPGSPGVGGAGGGAGHGAVCGGGSDPGHNGAPGDEAPAGASLGSGSNGTINCYNCQSATKP
jgi:hypothetical protein